VPFAINDREEPSRVLLEGKIEVEGEMPWSSNTTLLVRLGVEGEDPLMAIYKPLRGERPLWDFPPGLYRREVAAFELSRHLGWHLVPATVLRDDAPYGVGSIQRFVDADFSQHYFTLFEDETTHVQLQYMCAFDLLINNTDRKAGHCLIDSKGQIWGIDNGLAFHQEFKLRTVIWEFGGHPIPAEILNDIERLIEEGLPASMTTLLDEGEREAVLDRASFILNHKVFPIDSSRHRYPWPLI